MLSALISIHALGIPKMSHTHKNDDSEKFSTHRRHREKINFEIFISLVSTIE